MVILLIITDELQEWGRPLESYGASIDNKRLVFELFKISSDSLVQGNVNFNITIKINSKQNKKINEIVKNTLSDKINKFALYNYEFGKSKILITLNIIDSEDNKIASEEIIFRDESQLNLGL